MTIQHRLGEAIYEVLQEAIGGYIGEDFEEQVTTAIRERLNEEVDFDYCAEEACDKEAAKKVEESMETVDFDDVIAAHLQTNVVIGDHIDLNELAELVVNHEKLEMLEPSFAKVEEAASKSLRESPFACELEELRGEVRRLHEELSNREGVLTRLWKKVTGHE